MQENRKVLNKTLVLQRSAGPSETYYQRRLSQGETVCQEI